MLVEELGKAWKRRLAETPIDRSPKFTDAGLILGAGTILAHGECEGHAPDAEAEGRTLTLLSVAYGREIGQRDRTHIRKAIQSWRGQDLALASVHLALANLGAIRPAREAARRLFLADWMLSAGAGVQAITSALGIGAQPDPLTRRYNPDEPRVPKGSGIPSGQWTDGSVAAEAPRQVVADAAQQAERALRAAVGDKTVDAAEEGVSEAAQRAQRAVEASGSAVKTAFLKYLGNESAGLLADMAANAPAAFVFGAVLLIPEPNDITHKWVSVPGRGGLRYRQMGDFPGWQIAYTDGSGVDHDEVVREGRRGSLVRLSDGDEVGRFLPGGALALDLTATVPSSVRPDEPRACPFPSKDKPGQGPGTPGRVYEDQIKALVNPQQRTPSGFGMGLLNPLKPGDLVMFDDCELSSGTMIEAKGPTS